MKSFKLIFCTVVCLLIYLIYSTTSTKSLTYLSLGDALAYGENAYGEIGYGYSDYVASYLKRNKMLKFYTKDFASSGARIDDVLDIILENRTVKQNKKEYGIKELLRNANLITLSIGANDILTDLTLTSMDISVLNENEMVESMDEMFKSLEQLFITLKKYTKGKVIVIGYYNPFHEEEAKIKRLFSYFEKGYQELCETYHFTYLPLRNIFEYHDDYLPNPFNVHPGNQGYSAIGNKIVELVEEQFLKKI